MDGYVIMFAMNRWPFAGSIEIPGFLGLSSLASNRRKEHGMLKRCLRV